MALDCRAHSRLLGPSGMPSLRPRPAATAQGGLRALTRARARPQASCRRTLFTREGASEQSVPTSNVGSLSILRQVFRHADRRERQQRRASGTPGPPASYTLF